MSDVVRQQSHRHMWLACLFAATITIIVAGTGVSVRAADVGAAAVDEPQYLLTAQSLWDDGDLDIANQRADRAYAPYHNAALPVQTSILDGGQRISPHDPLLPLLIAPAFGIGGYLAVKWFLVGLAGLLAGLTTYVAVTRFSIHPALAGAVASVAGTTTPLVVYAHQVYPEIVAALFTITAVGCITSSRRYAPIGLILTVTALPWLSVKYSLVASALAVIALARWWGSHRHRAIAVATTLVVSGAIYIGAHWAIYKGFTAYATGDHFEKSGEFGVVGFSPNYVARSVRLIGLLVDQDYGLLAWSPAWILLLPAIGYLAFARDIPHRWLLLAPLAGGWLTATFVALTMHGFWWPGRQVVAVMPLAALAIAVLLTNMPTTWRRLTLTGAAGLGILGVATHSWATVLGHQGKFTWVGGPDFTNPWPIWRTTLPNYRALSTSDDVLHAVWIAIAFSLMISGWWLTRRQPKSPALDPNLPTVEGKSCD